MDYRAAASESPCHAQRSAAFSNLDVGSYLRLLHHGFMREGGRVENHRRQHAEAAPDCRAVQSTQEDAIAAIAIGRATAVAVLRDRPKDCSQNGQPQAHTKAGA